MESEAWGLVPAVRGQRIASQLVLSNVTRHVEVLRSTGGLLCRGAACRDFRLGVSWHMLKVRGGVGELCMTAQVIAVLR